MGLKAKIITDPNSSDIYEVIFDGTEIVSITRLDSFQDEPVDFADLSIELQCKINRIIRDE